MKDFTPSERRQIKDIIRIGILRRHAEWQSEMRELLNRPLEDRENEFDRSLTITNKSRNFFKEAMRMEDFYRNNWIDIGVTILLRGGYLTTDDLSPLSEELREYFFERLNYAT